MGQPIHFITMFCCLLITMAQFLLPLCDAHGGPTWGQFRLSYLPLIKFFPHVRKEISGHPGGLTNHPYVRK